MGKVEKHKRCLEEKTKQYFYLLLFIFSAKKELQAKCGLTSPELNKIWVKISKCKIMLFKGNILMKKKL